jgi:hypothetical protein
MNYYLLFANIGFYTHIRLLELLIGGPNQSHKVNFKELPRRERELADRLFVLASMGFSEIFLRSEERCR